MPVVGLLNPQLADTLTAARDAAAAVAVDYEILPSVTSVRSALEADAPAVFDEIPDNICYDWELGDREATEAAFKPARERFHHGQQNRSHALVISIRGVPIFGGPAFSAVAPRPARLLAGSGHNVTPAD